MKRKIAIFLLISVLLPLSAFAQYTAKNSFIRQALVVYTIDSQGFYQKTENVMVDIVVSAEKIYAYDKKAQNLYLRTNNGNYVVTLNKDYAKVIKKNKNIPQYSTEECMMLAKKESLYLDEKYFELNKAHRQALETARRKAYNDSVAAVRRREKAREDSIQKENKRYEEYRKANPKWKRMPRTKPVLCTDCNKYAADDTLFVVEINNDTLYFGTIGHIDLYEEYVKFHSVPIQDLIQKDEAVRLHCESYKDSLYKKDGEFTAEYLKTLNQYSLYGAAQNVIKKAPYGFFDDWGWDNDFSVSFNFTYVNTNKKVIKYIDVYWKITNDVGDVRRTGHFQGTGPVENFEKVSWEWDTSSYYVAGDASKMHITKVILTYMDGTKKVLNTNQIFYNDSEEISDGMKEYSY